MIIDKIKDKKVLFITTKNLDYIRNSQEISIIREHSKSFDVIGSGAKGYVKRLLHVYREIMTRSMKRYDVVFIGFAPQLIIPFFGFKFKKNTVIIDFFISMYDTLVFDRKKFSIDSIPAKILKSFDTKTIKAADVIISDTKEHGKYFQSEFGAPADRCEVLYLNADTNIYYKREQNKPEYLRDKFVVLYFGSILPLQGIDVIIDAAIKLKDEKDIYFYIVGPVPDKYDKEISETIRFIDWLSQDELAKYISYSDLCLAGHFNKNNNKANRTIPGKAYIYEAMGKPMILGDNAATHERYSESDEGIYFVEMSNSDALVEKILELFRNKKR